MINEAKLDKKNYDTLKKMVFFHFYRKKRTVYGYFKKVMIKINFLIKMGFYRLFMQNVEDYQ